MPKYQTKTFTGKTPLTLPNPDGRLAYHVIKVEFPTVAPIIGDMIQLCELPPGVRCLDYMFNFPDIDSNGAPAWGFNIGVENALGTDLASAYEFGITAGRTAAIVRGLVNTSAVEDISANRIISLRVSAAAATWAGADKHGYVVLGLID